MFVRLSVFLSVTLGLLLIVAFDAPAKGRGGGGHRGGGSSRGRNQQKDQPIVESVTIDGTIDAFVPGGFKMNGSKQQAGNNAKGGKKKGAAGGGTNSWLVGPGPATTWSITGSAELSYLKPGQTVVFKAELDDKYQPKDRVSTMTIVSPKGNIPGITADDGSGVLKPKDTGIGVDLPGEDKPVKTKTTRKKDAGDVVDLGGRKKITGRISSVSGNKFTVSAGSGKIMHVELDDSPSINVVSTDYKLVAVGARATVQGQAMESKQGNLCRANDIKITLALPLTGKTKPAVLRPEVPEKADAPAAKEEAGSGDKASDEVAKDLPELK